MSSRSLTTRLVGDLKESGQDFEFYPTTDEIIRALVRDVDKHTDCHSYSSKCTGASVLDIGAGDGRVLMAMGAAGTQGRFTDLYAIEKSPILCSRMDPSIVFVGTDFEEQSLLSKSVDVIFSNPPYSVFERWAQKIIRESSAPLVYLVVPARWKISDLVSDALAFRDAAVFVVGSYDFEGADRQARARVDLLRIELPNDKDSAFEAFFNEQFADLIDRMVAPSAAEEKAQAGMPMGGRRRPFDQLPEGPDMPAAMVSLYNKEMENVQRNYHLLNEMDADLLRELEVSVSRIMSCLKNRLSNLRMSYWSHLFDHIRSVTDRLTKKSRASLLKTLQSNTGVDFTVANIREVLVWAIKNANRFIDTQLVDTYTRMVEKANVVNYKSNQRVFTDHRWRYNHEEDNSTHYALDYRIVAARVGGIALSDYRYDSINGLSLSAAEFIGDLLTIANNLGFVCDTQPPPLVEGQGRWESNDSQQFFGTTKAGKTYELMEVKAFKNGNLHLRFNKKFILALNVEFGRLKGWLNSPEEAAEELKDPAAAGMFRSNLQLSVGEPLLQLQASSHTDP